MLDISTHDQSKQKINKIGKKHSIMEPFKKYVRSKLLIFEPSTHFHHSPTLF